MDRTRVGGFSKTNEANKSKEYRLKKNFWSCEKTKRQTARLTVRQNLPLFMVLIKEQKNVNFYVLDKPWTDAERKEFSEFIKSRKARRKKSITKPTKRKKILA